MVGDWAACLVGGFILFQVSTTQSLDSFILLIIQSSFVSVKIQQATSPSNK